MPNPIQPIEKTFHDTAASRGFLALAEDLLRDGHEQGVLGEVVAGRINASQVAHFLPGMELGLAVTLLVKALGAPAEEGVKVGVQYGKALLKTGKLDLRFVEIERPG